MGFLESMSNRVEHIFSDGNDEILLFILVFLFLFKENIFSSRSYDLEENNSGMVLFFIILFLLLFLNGDNILQGKVADEHDNII